MEIDLRLATDEWYEANKSRYWRESLASRSSFNRSNVKIDKNLFYIEDALEQAGVTISIDRFEYEKFSNLVRLYFHNDYFPKTELLPITQVTLITSGGRHPFYSIEAVLHTESDFNPYADGDRYTETSYPRIALIFRDKTD